MKVLLDEFCEGRKIKSLSASTIARIIRYLKDKNKIPNPKAKISFYAKTGKVKVYFLCSSFKDEVWFCLCLQIFER
ncbi:MAG: hypothetical protein ABIN15_04060 [candidate division WOR-3 bacterium]